MEQINLVDLLIVGLSPVKEASDGRGYFTAEFSAGFGQKTAKRNMWQVFENDTKTGLPTDKLKWERGSYEEALKAMNSRTPIQGAKVTKTVEPYFIGEGENSRQVNTYSTILFPDEISQVAKVFANANHPIVDEETGELLGKKRVILASEPAKEEVKETTSQEASENK